MAVATLDTAPADALPDALPLDTILCGDALEMLRTLPDNLVDSIVTDPPAGISFMGKGWDSNKGGRDAWIAWLAEIMRETWRVTKPGGHALVWALPRTSHWTAMALEDARWEIRDRCSHIFGSGFPKSLDVSKQLDKMAGAQREVVSEWRTGKSGTLGGKAAYAGLSGADVRRETRPATEAARQWDGWGTALKPAVEDWWLCRKPLSEGTVAANVLRWGTGALNIGASRVGVADDEPNRRNNPGIGTRPRTVYGDGLSLTRGPTLQQGRWPANLLLSHAPDCEPNRCSLWCPVRELDAQSGIRTSGSRRSNTPRKGKQGYSGGWGTDPSSATGDVGYASRFFTTFAYVPKASRSERNRGCEGLPQVAPAYGSATGDGLGRGISNTRQDLRHGNGHPTVKPLALMSWLIGLITPPGGIVLDPFAGSGSTLVAAKAGGWRYIGIEKEAEYVTIARARVQAS